MKISRFTVIPQGGHVMTIARFNNQVEKEKNYDEKKTKLGVPNLRKSILTLCVECGDSNCFTPWACSGTCVLQRIHWILKVLYREVFPTTSL